MKIRFNLLKGILLSFFAVYSVSGQVYEAVNVLDTYDELSPSDIAEANGKIYFGGESSYEVGEEPYVSDGTRAGTFMLKDIATSRAGDSRPTTFTEVGANVYFYATSESYGRELWISNGTTAGTRLVKDLRPGPNGSIGLNRSNDEQMIAEFGGKALFVGDDGLTGHELWITDGTAAGTLRLTDIDDRPEEDSYFGDDFFVFNNICYFQAGDDNSNGELWRTDGTVAGTYEILDMRQNSAGAPERFIEMGGKLYFRGRGNDASSWELWTTNGTAGGTQMIKQANDRAQSRIQWLTKMGNAIYFTADDYGTTGRELWRSDGTEVGTYMIKDIRVGRNDSAPSYLTVVGSTLYFVAEDGQNQEQLWKTNGQLGNATPVFSQPIFNGTRDADPQDLIEFQNLLFFKMDYVHTDGYDYGYEWFYLDSSGDLNIAGDINPGRYSGVSVGGGQRDGYAKTANGLFFSANNAGGYPNRELWRISRKMNITSQPANRIIHAGGDHTLSFTADQAVTNTQWYKDGRSIPGANSTSYTINDAQPDDAGLYRASCSNASSAATTDSAQIGVLESSNQSVGVKDGSTLTLSVTGHGTGFSYVWRRNSTNLSDVDSRVSGSRTPRLTIRDVVQADEGSYYCQVTMAGASLSSKIQEVSFVTKPVVATTAPPRALVSGEFTWQLQASQSPSKFLVSKLPAGLRYDSQTGLITGKPSRSGSYKVKVVAYNIVGKSESQIITFEVDSLPDNLAGTYFGEVDRNSSLNFDLGGSMVLKVNGRGVISGQMNLGGKKVRFKGRLNAARTGNSNASIEIRVRRGREAPYQMDFTFDPARQEANGSMSRNGSNATFRTDRNVWHSRNNPNLTYSGRFNCALDLNNALNGLRAYPQGHGYSIMKVSSTGKAKITGRAGDGTKFSVGTIASRLGEVSIFAPMHRNHASLHGLHTIKRYGTAPEYLDSTVTGTLSWLKKPNSRRSGRSYPDGFPLATVGTYGGEWTPITRGELVLDVPKTSAENARFLIRYGTMPSTNPQFNLTDKNKAVFDKVSNTYRMSAGFASKTGAFKGRFYKTDAHPLRPGKTLTRKATFSGLIIPGRNYGYGYTTIAELPTVAVPKPEIVTGAIFVTEL